jgi:amidophosphoribosyltransferase
MCGIIVAHSLHDVYKGLKALQHRGQEAGGIAVKKHDGTIDIVKWLGLVEEFSLDDLYKILGGSGIFIGHVRYSTSGVKESVDNAHPHYLGGEEKNYGRHMIVRNARIAGVHNGTIEDHKTFSSDDCDTRAFLRVYEQKGANVIKEIDAAYSVIILDSVQDGAIIIRDPFGIRPMWLGKKDGRFIAASEDHAILDIGGTPHREVRPGESVQILRDKNIPTSVRDGLPQKFCFFEWNYLANRNSSFSGRRVLEVRTKLGEELAREIPQEVIRRLDFVTYVPSAPEPCARGFSYATGVKHREIFYKKKSERSFMQPAQEQRNSSIHGNLFIHDTFDLQGKSILIIDDSIVRGNVHRNAIAKAREAGAKEVFFASCTPPIGEKKLDVEHGCLYGVDMPPADSFVARKYNLKDPKDFQKFVTDSKADGIFYISKAGLLRAIGLPENSLCMFCIGGPKPTAQTALGEFQRSASPQGMPTNELAAKVLRDSPLNL